MGDEKKLVLCVEDHPDTCELISHILKDYELISASTKSEAIQKARTGRFALILMDCFLPDGTGVDACNQIRTFDQKTPILFVTGSESFSESRARSLGAQGTLKKGNALFVEELRNRAVELSLI
jgi:CheY-like chemotaxis protein